MTIADNIETIREEIRAMCAYADVEENQPKLVGVSKVQSDERIKEALDAGMRVFGENRVQEAKKHWANLRSVYVDLELHLIGPLQSNKVSDAVELFDVIESVDRDKIARALSKEMDKRGRHLPIFIQVNTGKEEQKSGCMPEGLDTLITLCRDELGMNLVGLMCIPPVEEDPALHFALLKKLAKRHNLPRLSMGMSADFALAAAMGATEIRVGTALFGARDTKHA